MSTQHFNASFRWLLLLLAASLSLAARAAGDQYVIAPVNVVDVRSGAIAEDMAVEISGDRIGRILPAAALTGLGTAKVINASGKYLVPGFLDMHAHMIDNWAEPERIDALMLSHGVTGYRQMSGSEEQLQQRAEGRYAVNDSAPALLAMPAAVLVGQIASTPEEARETVAAQHAAGADFIKVVDVQPDVLMAVLAEARRLNTPVVGHLSANVDVEDAVSAGMKAIEHLGPGSSVLLSCSSDEAALRQALMESPPAHAPVLPDFVAWLLSPVIERVVERVLVNPILTTDEQGYKIMQQLVDSYSPEKCAAFAEQLAATPAWQVPTLIRLRTMEYGNDDSYRNSENLRYIPEEKLELWRSVGDDFADDLSSAQKATLKDFFALQMQLVTVFEQAGVKMLAGSDTGGGWIVPGVGLHQEFDLLAQAGITPLRVLQMTTLNGAEFLEMQEEMGSVEPGKVADLVILDANPLASVQNLRGVNAVVKHGKYHSADALKSIANREAGE